MMYEIPREMFKQRLEEPLNFVFVDLVAPERTPVKYKDTVHFAFGSNFASEFAAKYPNKNQNVVLFSLEKGDASPAKAAQALAQSGYNFVYYYLGTADDVVLDKGLN
jgi:rhodanese-related sulfurtransferase